MRTNLDPQEYFNKAVQTYQNGQVKEAEKMLRRLHKKFPDNDVILNALGSVLIDRKPIDASHLLKKATRINPANIDAWINYSSAQKKRGYNREALELIQKAKELKPERADIHYNEANIYLEFKDFENAEKSYLAAIELEPALTNAHFNLGNIYYFKRAINKAKKAFEKAIETNPDFAFALVNLGNIIADEGEFEAAKSLYFRATEAAPEYGAPYALLGKLYLDWNKKKEAKEFLLTCIEKDSKNKTAYILLGNLSKEEKDFDEAEACYRKALSIDPNDEGAQRNLRRLLNAQISGWHFTMLADEQRNNAYQKALENTVNNDSTVLDIGTGTGLLAMMAARAGAKKIIACEMHSKLAATAQEIIEANNYSKKIKILNKKSTELTTGTDLPEKANILVSEILDVGVIGEGVLPTIRHAVKNLITDDAIIIPAKVQLFGQLVEIPLRSRMNPIKNISGFDLSAFDKFRIPHEYTTIHLNHENHTALSDIFPITEFDFYSLPEAVQDDQPISETLNVKINNSGELQGVVFWFDLTLHENIVVSSRPEGELTHWGQALYCFENPASVSDGDTKEIKFIRSDQLIRFGV
ncbi:MAG: tetratricopeptide repeat protein [Bacteroidota bacterium]